MKDGGNAALRAPTPDDADKAAREWMEAFDGFYLKDKATVATAAYKAGYLAARSSGTGWRPISEAPKDGTVVWLYAQDQQWLGAFEQVTFGSSSWRVQGYVADRVTLTAGVIQPTHWQPLPTPPDAPPSQEGNP